MKHLLAVSWEMPPMFGPRATQVTRVLKELRNFNWESSVVCLDPKRGGPNWQVAKESRGGAADPGSLGVGPQAVSKESRDGGLTLVRVPSPEEWLIVRSAWRLLPFLHEWRNAKWLWVGPAERASKKIVATTAIDALVTFGQPWGSHLVGLRVHRTTGLPWVAHFSDPWIDNPYLVAPAWVMRVWSQLEREVISRATAVVFVTAETADLVMRKYPEDWRQKVAIVPHAFDSIVRSNLETTVAKGPSTGPLRIVYTGRFYSGARTPLTFFRALAAMNDDGKLAETIQVRLVGPHNDEFRRDAVTMGLKSIVSFQGRVPHDEARAIAADADVLLVIDAPSTDPSVFLPSKLIEYLSLRKQIFGITPQAGASAALLRRAGCPVASPDDVDGIRSVLADLVCRKRAGTIDVSLLFDRVAEEFDVRRIAGRFNEVLSHACDCGVAS